MVKQTKLNKCRLCLRFLDYIENMFFDRSKGLCNNCYNKYELKGVK